MVAPRRGLALTFLRSLLSGLGEALGSGLGKLIVEGVRRALGWAGDDEDGDAVEVES